MLALAESLSVAGRGGAATDAARARYRVDGRTEWRCVEGGVQTVVGSGEAFVEVLVLRDASVESEVIDDTAPLLPSSLVWDVTGLSPPGHGALAREVAGLVMRSVRSRVRPERIYVPQEPSETWESRRGDCTEISDLTAALLRGLGVNARVAGGLLDVEGELRYHAWVEYWDGRWATLDPTLGQHPASAGRVRLDCAESTAELHELERSIGDVTVSFVSAAPFHRAAQ